MTSFDFPPHIDGRGRFAVTGDDDHVRDMIYQVLFTTPGERVNRPDFGCGLLQMVFMPNSEPLAIATEFTIKSTLHKWLGDIIQTDRVKVTSEDSTLRVEVVYRRRLGGAQTAITFEQPT